MSKCYFTIVKIKWKPYVSVYAYECEYIYTYAHMLENNCKMKTPCKHTTKQMRSQHKLISSGDIIVFAVYTGTLKWHCGDVC